MADVGFWGMQAVFAWIGIFFLLLTVSSSWEREFRAGLICFGFITAWVLLWAFVTTHDSSLLNLVIFSSAVLFCIVSLFRFFPESSRKRDVSAAIQFDERDHMFARNNLKNHPELADTYYRMRPENRSHDRQIHGKPDFGDPGQVYYDFYTTPCYVFMAYFCRICKKCARNCPSGSITFDEEPKSRGFFHWSIDQEKCFSYWKTIGSDCGMCISVCPYTKPDSFAHRLVRFYISRNSINQRIALFMDNLLYGRCKKITKHNPDPLFF